MSIIIGYRNRETERVKYCLESLANQTVLGFEVIIVDYGSDKEIAEEIKKLTLSYSFVQYIYSDTRGWYWNRAHAINIGIKLAKGEIVLISDIDLILPQNFVSKLLSFSFDKLFYTFLCYYLNKDTNINSINDMDIKDSEVGYVGLCAVLKKYLVGISGLDEYYMYWGGEDDDLYARLQKQGYLWKRSNIQEFPVLHQWHPKQSPTSPSPWYLDMVTRLYADNLNADSLLSKNFGSLVRTSDRNIFQFKDYEHILNKIELFPNPLFQFNVFLDSFYKMKSGEYGYMCYPVVSELPKGRKQKIIEFINKCLLQFDIPYFINIRNIKLPIHTKDTWDDFIMYFIGRNRELLTDYYITNTNKEQSIFFLKK